MKPSPHPSFFLALVCSFLFLLPLSHAQQAEKSTTALREWTNLEGRKLSAQYLGHKDAEVALQLKDGKIVFIPAIKLTTADNLFLKNHHKIYMPAWQAWPPESRKRITTINVAEQLTDAGGACYTTANFRFQSDVNLGTTLMKDVATVFELTYQLHKTSPLGVLAKPDGTHYPARLFGKTEHYWKQGGPRNSSGVYLVKEKTFLAPLELMGMQSGSAGWRKIHKQYDPSTLVHELTHMLTHDVLDVLPIWINEGYAEYISHIPIKADAFQTDKTSIREAIRDAVFDVHVQSTTPRGAQPRKYSRAEKTEYLTSKSVDPLPRVSQLLTMTDVEWATDRAPTLFSTRLPRLYRTAHLVMFYFLEIEGEAGVGKIRKFLEKNRTQMIAFQQYLDAYKNYQQEWEAFIALPGVKKMPDNTVQYPSDLTPPTPPKAPTQDPNTIKLHGLSELLAGETAEVVGARIEQALVKELEINFSFQ